MTRADHLLVILMEECAEVAQRCSKALRFGIDDVQEDQPLPNSERIGVELDDLLAVVGMLRDEGILRDIYVPAQIRKVQRVEDYLDYSQGEGRLEVTP